MCSHPEPPPNSIPTHPSGSSQCTSPEHPVSCILDWWSISHMVIYMFQCYSLKSPTLAFSHRVQKSVLYIWHRISFGDENVLSRSWWYCTTLWYTKGFPGGSDSKESACTAGDLSSVPRLGTSPGGGHGNPLQYSCLENPHGQRNLVGYSPWHRCSLHCKGGPNRILCLNFV